MGTDKYLVKGERLFLRLMEEADFPSVVEWRNKKRIQDNFIYREKFTLEGQKKWQETMIDTGKVVQFMICEKEKDLRAVGCVYFRDIDMDEKSAEYGIFIGEDDALRKGYGDETADLAVKYAKDTMGLKKLILRVFSFNTPAIRSYEHAGFVKCADLPMVECSDGQKSDMILMEMSL